MDDSNVKVCDVSGSASARGSLGRSSQRRGLAGRCVAAVLLLAAAAFAVVTLLPHQAFAAPGDEEPLAADSVIVTYAADPADMGTVSVVENTVDRATGQGITGSVATANYGKVFVGWYQGDELITSDATLTEAQARAHMKVNGTGSLQPTVFLARFGNPTPGVVLQKAVTAAPSNGLYFVVGESVPFSITVTNTGNVTLTKVTISDSLAAIDPLANLAPGESRTVSYSYTVTEGDAAAGYVTNVASARASVEGWATKTIKSDPVSAAVMAKEAPKGNSYVLYGAYPAAGGTVDIPYEVISGDAADGLSPVTATAAEGYTFAGWYRHDGKLVSSEPVLGVSVIRDSLPTAEGGKTFEPALYLAYFTPQSEENPDSPEPPDEGDDTETPVPPAGTDEGNEGNGGDEGNGSEASAGADEAAGDGAASGTDATADKKPAYHTMAKSAPGAKSMPQTGDELGLALAMLLSASAIAAALLLLAGRSGRAR